MMISLLFIALSAICKAVVDTLLHHFDTSIFKGKKNTWWDPSISWKTAKVLPFTTYKVDGFHVFNSGMVVFMCIGWAVHDHFLWWGWEVLIAGAVWNIVFGIFYSKVFIKKP